MSDLVGYVGATLTTLSFLPQAVRTLRTRDTRGLSLAMYLLFTAGVACWFAYGLTLGSWPIILSNGVTGVLALVILLVKLRHG